MNGFAAFLFIFSQLFVADQRKPIIYPNMYVRLPSRVRMCHRYKASPVYK